MPALRRGQNNSALMDVLFLPAIIHQSWSVKNLLGGGMKIREEKWVGQAFVMFVMQCISDK